MRGLSGTARAWRATHGKVVAQVRSADTDSLARRLEHSYVLPHDLRVAKRGPPVDLTLSYKLRGRNARA